MKKFIALAVALAVGSASLFALPAAGIQDNSQPLQSIQSVKTQTVKADVSKNVPVAARTQIADSAEDDLFAEVQSVSLTDEEAQAVEGEGAWGAFFGGIIGAIVGGAIGGNDGATTGATIGIAIGWVFPLF